MNEEEEVEYEEIEEVEEEEKKEEPIKKDEVIENNDKKEENVQVTNNNTINKNDEIVADIKNVKIDDNNLTKQENTVKKNKTDNELKKPKQKENKNINSIFNKKIKDFEQLSQKVDIVLDKLQLNNKKKKEDNINKTKKPEDKILLEKEMQIKNSLSMIHNLTRENKKLKEEIESLNKRLIYSDDLTQLEQISSKSAEIEKLKKKIIDLTKKYDEAKRLNVSYETQINQLKEIINRYKVKLVDLKSKYDSINNEGKVKLDKINRNNLDTKENKLIKSASDINIKKMRSKKTAYSILNDNFYHLLTDKEKNSLKNLFGTNEDYMSFTNKINILETRNQIAEKKLEIEIDNLNQLVKDKEINIDKLNKELEKKDRKISTLENKLNTLRTKNKIINNKQKKILSVEEQLKQNGFKINATSKKDKLEKLNILVNHYKEELDKNYIEKCKVEEISTINKQIGNINFFDTKFFDNFTKTKKIKPISTAK